MRVRGYMLIIIYDRKNECCHNRQCSSYYPAEVYKATPYRLIMVPGYKYQRINAKSTKLMHGTGKQINVRWAALIYIKVHKLIIEFDVSKADVESRVEQQGFPSVRVSPGKSSHVSPSLSRLNTWRRKVRAHVFTCTSRHMKKHGNTINKSLAKVLL